MSEKKKSTRKAFRESVFARDRYHCAMCGIPGMDRQGGDNHKRFHKEENPVELDAHHITPREEMPNGGYVPENGISVCPRCHIKAEDQLLNFRPEDLYKEIGSSKHKAIETSRRLE